MKSSHRLCFSVDNSNLPSDRCPVPFEPSDVLRDNFDSVEDKSISSSSSSGGVKEQVTSLEESLPLDVTPEPDPEQHELNDSEVVDKEVDQLVDEMLENTEFFG